MKFSYFFTLATSVISLPVIEDIHDTTIEVFERPPEYDKAAHFLVQVTRLDELIETDDAQKKAVRASAVILEFDVSQNGEIVLNSVPVRMGLSKVQVNAAISIATLGDFTLEEAQKDFDIGLVDVEVYCQASLTPYDDGTLIKRIKLLEKVISINGNAVEQLVFMQQLIEVLDDGTVRKFSPELISYADYSSWTQDTAAVPIDLIISLIAISFLATCILIYSEENTYEDGMETIHPSSYQECPSDEKEKIEEELPLYEEPKN
jgi:hypothetical protein